MNARELVQIILGMSVGSVAAVTFLIGLTVVMGAYCQP